MAILYPAVRKGTITADDTLLGVLDRELMLVQKDKIDTDEFIEIQAEILTFVNLKGMTHFLLTDGVVEEGTLCSLGGGVGGSVSEITTTSDAVKMMDDSFRRLSEVRCGKEFSKIIKPRSEGVRIRYGDAWVRYDINKRLPILVDSENIHLTAVQDVKAGDYVVEYKGDMSVFDKHQVKDVESVVASAYVLPIALNYDIPDEEVDAWLEETNLPLISLNDLLDQIEEGTLVLDPTRSLGVFVEGLLSYMAKNKQD